MPTQLKYVDPNRPRSAFSRAYATFSATGLGRLISANVMWKDHPVFALPERHTCQ